jgi:hypothetical protein
MRLFLKRSNLEQKVGVKMSQSIHADFKEVTQERYWEIYQELTLLIKGRVIWCADNSSYCRDFGGTTLKKPKIAVHVTCEEDILETFKVANVYKIPVAVRGAGHSCNGQTLSDGILLINRAQEQTDQICIGENNIVMTPTRLAWSELEEKLNHQNLSFPVLTDLLSTTIGGTLSVGGGGVKSLKYGCQVDQVLKIKLILPSGRVLWCSEEENADLFHYSLAGLGSIGLIETVFLKTIPRRAFSLVYNRIMPPYPLHKILEPCIALATQKDSPDWMRLNLSPSSLQAFPHAILTYGYEASTETNTFSEKDHHFNRSKIIQKWSERIERNINLFCDYILKPRAAEEFLLFIEKNFSSPFFSNLTSLYILPVKRPSYSPWIPLHPAQQKLQLYFGIGLYFSIPTESYEQLSNKISIQEFLNSLLERCMELGGRPYLYGTHMINHETASRIYGEDYLKLIKLKEQHDTNKILPGIFSFIQQ